MLPKGQTAESIVQDVIAKTFNEERNWDPEKGRTPYMVKVGDPERG